MKVKRAPKYQPLVGENESVIHHVYHQPPIHEPRTIDYSSSGLWIVSGFLFALIVIPLALLIDISSPNSGGRAIAAVKGFAVAILLGAVLVLAGGTV